jgi:hypothetical protein
MDETGSTAFVLLEVVSLLQHVSAQIMRTVELIYRLWQHLFPMCVWIIHLQVIQTERECSETKRGGQLGSFVGNQRQNWLCYGNLQLSKIAAK